jgi:hypothetical protein
MMNVPSVSPTLSSSLGSIVVVPLDVVVVPLDVVLAIVVLDTVVLGSTDVVDPLVEPSWPTTGPQPSTIHTIPSQPLRRTSYPSKSNIAWIAGSAQPRRPDIVPTRCFALLGPSRLIVRISRRVITGPASANGPDMSRLRLASLPLLVIACSNPPSMEGSSSSSSSGAAQSGTTHADADASSDSATTDTTTTGDPTTGISTSAMTDPTTSSTTGEVETGGVPGPCEDLGNAVPLEVLGTTATAMDNATVVGVRCQLAWGDANDATYVWSAPAAGWYTFTAASPMSQSVVPLSLFDGCGGEPLQCEYANGPDFNATLAAELEADQTVMIAVDSTYPGNEAPFTLRIDHLTPCGAPIDLGSELVTALPGDIRGQGDEVWGGCGYSTAMSIADVTYTWTAPDTGIYSVSATATGFAGTVTVYRGHCGNPSDEAACNFTTGEDGGVHVGFPAQAGEQLVFVVDGWAGTMSTAYELDIVAVTPLVGDCCVANGTTGCEDFDVVACTCQVSADCCDPAIGWPEACAGIAGGLCGGCPPQPPGDCCDAHDSYGCSNEFVSACACQITGGSCCGPEVFFAETWDDWCILNAEWYCNLDCP